MMKIIKTDRRTSLHTNTLSDLLEIKWKAHLLLRFHLTELSNSGGMTANDKKSKPGSQKSVQTKINKY